jgi:kumamolisin
MLRRINLVTFSIVAVLTVVAMNSHAQSLMTRHVRDVVLNGQAQPVGRLPATQTMKFDIVLPLRDKAGLDAFVADVYDLNSPNYHHFLTPEETSERFGPIQEDWDALINFAKSHGFTIVSGSLGKRDLVLTGTVSAIESAFNVQMRTYQHPTESRVFYAVDREPNMSLPFQIEHISGLDNYSIPHPRLVKRSDYAAAHGISEDAVVSHATTGSGPSASFLGSDMRAAYYGGTALTGTGQTIGLFEYVGTDLADLTTYYNNVGQTEPFTPKLVSVDGTSLTCTCSSKNMTTCENGTTTTSCDDGEQNLDMTQAMSMAPGLAGLTMYVGGTDTAIISAMTTTADGPLPSAIGCSWGWTPADPSTLDTYFEIMAAQGQNFFAASGDSSTWSSSNEAWPADDAYVVSVGGTDLVTSSAAGPWSSETAWVDSGDGISPDSIAIPSWQKLAGVITSTNKGSTTLRNGPDVSANANFTFYTCADQTTCQANVYGGTSFAAPMWAGYMALVNQQYAANNPTATVKSVGFINPIIYPLALTSAYGTDFHDITSGTSGSYSANTGFDLVTGWGSPKGTGLINALAPATAASFSLSATNVAVTASSTTTTAGTSTVTETIINGFSSPVTLTASGMPSGVTAAFSPASITGAGASTLTFTVPANQAASTSTITVTGTPASGAAKTTTLTLTITAAATPSFSLSATNASVTASSTTTTTATSTVTETITNGFSSAVTLTASGMPSGVTAAFSPTSITGAGTSTLTFTVPANQAASTSTITVTGTPASGAAKTTTLTLTITASGGGGGAQIATYNSTYTAPACLTAGLSCDSGPTLLLGNGAMSGGAEPNQPNTLKASSCADGSSGTFHSDESNDRLVVTSSSGNITAGTPVTVTASVWAYSKTQDYLDLYYTASVTSPSWVLIKSNILPTTAGAENTLSSSFTPPTSGTYAVRAQFRYATSLVASPSACQANSGYDDHDDLVFAVGAGSVGTPGFTTAASPATLGVAQSSAANSTITITSTNSFNSAVTLSASGLPTGVTAAFATNPVTPPANGNVTSTLTLTAASTAAVGTYTVTITGTSGSLSAQSTIALTITTAGGAQIATYNSTYTAPACLTAGLSCDSGPTLLLGNGNMSGGAEPNQPNTLKASSCADGSSGTFHSDESNDRLVVTSSSGNLTHGTSVTVTASVWAYSTTQDYLDLYYTASVTSPSWVLIKSNILPTTAGAENTLSSTFTPPTSGTYAVRAQFRYATSLVTSPSACRANSGYDDHDDLVFAVQ